MSSFTQIINSPNFYRSPKSEHGEFCIYVNGDILIVFPKGTWAMRCVRKYIATLEKIFEEKQYVKFGGIVCLGSWNLGTPEVLKALSDYSKKSRKRGLKYEWLISKKTSDIALTVADAHVTKQNDYSFITDDILPAIAHLSEHNLSFDADAIKTIFENQENLWIG